jgi:hypothetical protein
MRKPARRIVVGRQVYGVYVPNTKKVDGKVFYSVIGNRSDIYLNPKYNKRRTFSWRMAQEVANKLRSPGLNVRVFQMEDGRFMVYVRRADRDYPKR